jgi:hypothetical protein
LEECARRITSVRLFRSPGMAAGYFETRQGQLSQNSLPPYQYRVQLKATPFTLGFRISISPQKWSPSHLFITIYFSKDIYNFLRIQGYMHAQLSQLWHGEPSHEDELIICLKSARDPCLSSEHLSWYALPATDYYVLGTVLRYCVSEPYSRWVWHSLESLRILDTGWGDCPLACRFWAWPWYCQHM